MERAGFILWEAQILTGPLESSYLSEHDNHRMSMKGVHAHGHWAVFECFIAPVHAISSPLKCQPITALLLPDQQRALCETSRT